MNLRDISNVTKQQFDSTMKKEGMTVSDYYDNNKTYKIFFRSSNRGNSPQGKLRLYYSTDTDISIGTIFTLKGKNYLVISQDALESDVFITSLAVRCDTTFTVYSNAENRYVIVPFVTTSDKYTVSHGNTLSMINGSVVCYTGLNEYAKEMQINNMYQNYGGFYKVGNYFFNDNLAYFYLSRELDRQDTYSLIYNGVNSLDLSDGSYQLTYTAIKNGTVVNSPALSYSVSDETVATVSDGGLLTMLKEGSVTVSAVWTDGENTTFSTPITIVGANVPPVVTGTISLTGDAELSVGFANTYTAQFIGTDGNAVSGLSPVWTITNCNFVDSIYQTPTGNSIELLVEDEAFLDETFTLNVSDADNRFTQASMTITITSLF